MNTTTWQMNIPILKVTPVHTPQGSNTLVFTFISRMQFIHSLLNKVGMQTNIHIPYKHYQIKITGTSVISILMDL